MGDDAGGGGGGIREAWVEEWGSSMGPGCDAFSENVMSEEENDRLGELVREVHELRDAAKPGGRSWLTRNASLVAIAVSLSLAGLAAWSSVTNRILTLESDMRHHGAIDYHEGMKRTPIALERIESDLRHLKEAVDELKKKLGEG